MAVKAMTASTELAGSVPSTTWSMVTPVMPIMPIPVRAGGSMPSRRRSTPNAWSASRSRF